MAPLKILIVEDHQPSAELMADILTLEGFVPLMAFDGPSGIEKAKSEKPELILLDVMLPGLNGLEVCKRLKADNGTKNIPILIVTAKDSEQDKKDEMEAGCDGCVFKPFDVEALVKKINECISAKKSA